MKEFNAIVIGSGNGGLAAAIRLLQGGAKVLVVEKHNLPGGFATSFRRGRFEFEASLHELNDFGTPENVGDLRALFDSLGITNKVEWLQVPEAFRLISRKEKIDASMPFGVDAFTAKMEYYVPGSRPAMEKFFILAKNIHDAQSYSNSVSGKTDSKIMVEKYGNFVRSGSYSVNEVLRSINMPQKAMEIFNTYWVYLGAHCDDLSFTHYASMVYRYLIRGAAMPKSRSHEISIAMTERIRELGGEIWFNTEVSEIKTATDGSVSSVVFSDGMEIKTRHVVANCAPHNVFGRMMKNVPDAEIRATNARKLSGRGFTIFLGLNRSADELGISNHNYFLFDTSDTVEQYKLMETIRDNTAQATVCLNRAHPDCSPKGTAIMYFTTLYMTDDWGNIKPEDYFRTKNEVARRMITRFEQDTGTKIHDAIEEIAIATPMTYAHYCGHPQGVIYGYESQYWDGLTPRLMMMAEDSRVQGLRFVGGYAMRLSGYSSAYFSGDIVGRQTLGDLKVEG